MLSNVFKVFTYPNAFSPKECRKIIKALDRSHRMFNLDVGVTDAKETQVYDAFRKCTGTSVPKAETEFSWIRNRIIRHANEANEVYKAKITSELTDDLQFLKYGPGGHFLRHSDVRGSKNIALRELSVVVQLSSPKEYRGGELRMQTLSKRGFDTAAKEQGTIIVFQSCLYHQVTPVTAGLRYSMVAWMARSRTIWDKLRGIPKAPGTI